MWTRVKNCKNTVVNLSARHPPSPARRQMVNCSMNMSIIRRSDSCGVGHTEWNGREPRRVLPAAPRSSSSRRSSTIWNHQQKRSDGLLDARIAGTWALRSMLQRGKRSYGALDGQFLGSTTTNRRFDVWIAVLPHLKTVSVWSTDIWASANISNKVADRKPPRAESSGQGLHRETREPRPMCNGDLRTLFRSSGDQLPVAEKAGRLRKSIVEPGRGVYPKKPVIVRLTPRSIADFAADEAHQPPLYRSARRVPGSVLSRNWWTQGSMTKWARRIVVRGPKPSHTAAPSWTFGDRARATSGGLLARA